MQGGDVENEMWPWFRNQCGELCGTNHKVAIVCVASPLSRSGETLSSVKLISTFLFITRPPYRPVSLQLEAITKRLHRYEAVCMP